VSRKGEPEIGPLTVRHADRRRGHLLDLKLKRPEPVADDAGDWLVAGRDQRVRARLGERGRQLVARLPLEHEAARRSYQIKIHLLRVFDHVQQKLFARRGVELVTHAIHGRGGLAADGRVPRDPLLAVRRHVPELKGVAAGLVAAAVDLQRVRAASGQCQRSAILAVVGKVDLRVDRAAGRVPQTGLQNRIGAGRSAKIDVDRLADGRVESPLLGRAGRRDAARI